MNGKQIFFEKCFSKNEKHFSKNKKNRITRTSSDSPPSKNEISFSREARRKFLTFCAEGAEKNFLRALLFLVQEARGPNLGTRGRPAPRAEVARRRRKEGGTRQNLATPTQRVGNKKVKN